MSERLFEHEANADVSEPVKPTCGGKRFIEVPGRGQLAFEARCIEDFVRENAPVRLFDEIVSRLDFSAFDRHFAGGGRPAWRPMLLAKVLLFAYSVGMRSAREISRRLENDLRLMWVAHEQQIGHQRLSEFRRRFSSELAELFVQTVQLAREMGLMDLGLVAIDGSKVAASARRRTLDDEALRKQIDKLLAEVERVDAAEDEEFGEARGDEIPADLRDPRKRLEKLQRALEAREASGQKRVSVSDPEALVQKTTGGLRPGYNTQIAVEKKSGMIVAQDVTDAQNDTGQLQSMLEQTIENTGSKPTVAVADTGYHSGENLKAVEKLKVEAYIAQQPQSHDEDDDHFAQDDFDYDGDRDEFICPAGKRLIYRRDKERRGVLQRLYATGHADCRGCTHRGRCLPPKGKRRELYVTPHVHLTRWMRTRLKSEQGQWAMKQRGQVVEPVFGTIKAVLGLRQFLLRGLEGARAEMALAAGAFNLRKLALAWP